MKEHIDQHWRLQGTATSTATSKLPGRDIEQSKETPMDNSWRWPPDEWQWRLDRRLDDPATSTARGLDIERSKETPAENFWRWPTGDPGMSIDDEPWLTSICADPWATLIYGRWTTSMAIDDDRLAMVIVGRQWMMIVGRQQW